jgi:hypothetical protein
VAAVRSNFEILFDHLISIPMHRSNAPLYFPWKCVYIPGTFPGCIIVEFRWRDIFCTLPTDEDELREFQAPRYKFNFLMLLELYGFLLADVP